MAHKTLIGGTQYGIKGGTTLVSGTSYSVKKGKTLIGGTEYDISFLLPPAALDVWSGENASINCIAYASGYWVVGGSYYDGSYRYARIAYTTSVDGAWTVKDLWAGSNGPNYVTCITYANGYWVVGGSYRSGSTYRAYIAYATTPDGTWTNQSVWTASYSEVTGIAYGDGYWVVAGYYGSDANNARIAYATSLSGSWSTKVLWSETSNNYTNTINCITYANGYWVVGGVRTYNNRTCYALIAYATTPSGTWTKNDLWSSSYSGISNAYISGIIYENGYWVVTGKYYSGSGGIYNLSIAYSTSLDGTWTTKDLWNGAGDTTCIAYANGYWVVCGKYSSNGILYARIVYTTSLSGSWVVKDVWSGTTFDSIIKGITYGDSYWMVGGQQYDGSSYNARIAYTSDLSQFDQI